MAEEKRNETDEELMERFYSFVREINCGQIRGIRS